ncbi:hypothetical protein [Chamaesiphon sp. OTE_8_metabat_110]|uniref:hypothetical protein n=1 Tax=Chamaesiphon sp. OTE_8_metabat_110 TaxID=2964696 RepID=UPI00286A1EF5|nr:hypothetical protein [Chamaesiphon sp. OTE_8_metabat_110]
MKKIIIKLGNGDLAAGFSSVNIELRAIDRTVWEDKCSLQAAPDLKSSLNQWELLYKEIVRLNRDELHRGVKFADRAITNVSIQDLRNLHDRLKIELNKWLCESDFSRIERSLRTKLGETEEIIVIIQASQRSIWQLPWYLWDFFTDYPLAVEVFSNPENTDLSNPLVMPNAKVDILALFGIDPLLDLDRDFQCLQSLPDVNLKPFETTSAQDIVARLNLDAPDILYLSGHGESVEYERELEGVIYLDPHTTIEVSTLKPEIKKAVARGLQIAIFNCCSGLGIAHQLRDANITYLIVMRAEIPNRIAQEFLEKLLAEYSNGANFVRAFQLARARISISTESWLKFANWLPVLFHNPLSHPVSWQDFIEVAKSELTPNYLTDICRTISAPKYRFWTSFGLSLVIAGLSMGLKSSELSQRVENLTTDLLSQLQPANDDNIVLLKPPLRVLGKLNNPQILTAAIEQIDRHAQPQAFLTDNHLKQYLSQTSIEHQWKLNSRVFDRLKSVTTESLSAASPAQLQDLFHGKIVIIGERDTLIHKPLTAINSFSLKDDRPAIYSNLNLLKIPSQPEQFLWIFGWCHLSILAGWQIGTRLFVPIFIAVVGSQIILGGVMLVMGNGVPIVITSIATIGTGIIATNALVDSE